MAPEAEPRNDQIGLSAEAEEAADGILVVAADGRITHVTRRLGAMLGYGPDELVGKPLEVLVGEEQREAHRIDRGHYAIAPRAREMGSGLNLQARCRNGDRLAVDIRLAPLPGGSVVASVRDVSGERSTHDALVSEQARHKAAAERELSTRAICDLVIQQLFGVAATLMGQAAVSPPSTAARLATCVEQLETTIEMIRHGVLTPRVGDDGMAALQQSMASNWRHLGAETERRESTRKVGR